MLFFVTNFPWLENGWSRKPSESKFQMSIISFNAFSNVTLLNGLKTFSEVLDHEFMKTARRHQTFRPGQFRIKSNNRPPQPVISKSDPVIQFEIHMEYCLLFPTAEYFKAKMNIISTSASNV